MLQKNKYRKLLSVAGLCLLLSGCRKESLFFTTQNPEDFILQEEVVSMSEEEITKEKEQQEAASGTQKTEETTEDTKEEILIAVHVCGAVNTPGVYYLQTGQRIYEGIQMAGGFREDADSEYLNQAGFLEDGMKIVVPTMEETKNLKMTEEGETAPQIGIVTARQSNGEANDGKVNLNTADEALLCTLPGIGESRAKSIIAYRKEHGSFEKTEDIMKVSGIKEAAFEKIKDAITVSN